MTFWSRVGRLLTVDDTILDEGFSLIEDEDDQIEDDDKPDRPNSRKEERRDAKQVNEKRPKEVAKTNGSQKEDSQSQLNEAKPAKPSRPARSKHGFVKPRQVGRRYDTPNDPAQDGTRSMEAVIGEQKDEPSKGADEVLPKSSPSEDRPNGQKTERSAIREGADRPDGLGRQDGQSEAESDEQIKEQGQTSKGTDRHKALNDRDSQSAVQSEEGTTGQRAASGGRDRQPILKRRDSQSGKNAQSNGQENEQDSEQKQEDGKAAGLPRDSEKNRGKRTEEIPEKLSSELFINRQVVEKIFFLPKNADVIIRDFTIASTPPIKAAVVFLEGMSDKTIINSNILEPLMLFAGLPQHDTTKTRLQLVKERLVPGNQVMEFQNWEDVKKGVLSGSSALLIDGAEKALVVETKGWEHRSVSDTKTETVVRGPHDAFNENLRTNTGLVRSRFRSERLITEMLQVGKLAPTDVAIMYVEGLTNQKLVREVKRRIRAVDVDFLQDSGTMEQMIEDPQPSLVPKLMATERPDRVAAFLSEGFVAIFVGHSPYVMIVPSLLMSMIHTAEDAYILYPFGSFIRVIRLIAFVIAMLLPAAYIAATNYHPEMIPTDLMLTIASAREKVPFPVVIEVLLMESALELIREAGIRIPNVIGPTIGIVGALILGQAAVQAGVVSPLLVIVVAVTALAAFTMPNYNMSFAVRTLRFVFIFAAAGWGFYGITLMVMFTLSHWATLKSFGVPIMSPLAPHQQSSSDVILRGRVYYNEVRPLSLRPQDPVRQKRLIRTWAANVPRSKEAKKRMIADMNRPTLFPDHDVKVPPEMNEEEEQNDHD